MKRLIKNRIVAICIISSFVLFPASGLTKGKKAEEATSYIAPDYWPTKGWRTSTPEKQGISSYELVDMAEYIKNKKYYVESITIIRNGYIVFDAYVYPFSKGENHIIHSCTKSIVSALVGIAIDKKYISSVNTPVLDFFPRRKILNIDEQKRKITLKNLLNMASGLNTMDTYLYGWKGLTEMKNSEDWVQYVLDRPMAEPPGSRFEYSNCVSFLLSAIIQKTTRTTTLKFARKYFFGPLGINDVEWKANPQGIYFGWGDMHLKPHDMAKIGFLYLNKGLWDGKQIVPASWVEVSTQGYIDATLFDRYGYHWWVDQSGYYAAVGYLGQFIFVIPNKNMVVVFTSTLAGKNFYFPKTLLEEYIIPAAKSRVPLDANPTANKHLNSLLGVFLKAPGSY